MLFQKLTLKRHYFKDRPDWKLINEDVPIGTVYIMVDINMGNITWKDTGETRRIPIVGVFKYYGETIEDVGWLPEEVFED